MAKHTSGAVTKSIAHNDYYFEQVPFDLELHSTGITGAPDAKWNPRTSFTYAGAFRIPYVSNGGSDVWFSTRETQFTFDTATNSIWMGKFRNSNEIVLSQFSVPALSQSLDINDLNTATQLQPFTSITAALAPIDGITLTNIGFMKKIGDRLYAGTYQAYQPIDNKNNVIMVDGLSDLSTATLHGYVELREPDQTPLFNRGATIAFDIPLEHRADFGGLPHGIACGNHPSISSKWTDGHTFNSCDLSAIGLSDTTYSNVNRYMYHDNLNSIGGWNDNNSEVADYYHAYFCNPAELPLHAANNNDAYLYLPETQKLTFEQAVKLPRPSKATYTNVAGWEVGARGAFIPPNSDTVVYVGEIIGAELGRVYKGQSLEYTGPQITKAGPEAISRKDYKNCIWCVNLNDIKNAVNLHDPQYCYLGNFADQWSEFSNGASRGRIAGASFDSATNKLYVLHRDIYNPTNTTQTQHIVSVFDVAAGV